MYHYIDLRIVFVVIYVAHRLDYYCAALPFTQTDLSLSKVVINCAVARLVVR